MREIALAERRPCSAARQTRRSPSTTPPGRTPIRLRRSTSARACRRCARSGSPSAATPNSSPGPSSRVRPRAANDPKLAAVRFNRRLPRRALPGANVTQMHYARRGIVTPEMEFVAHPREPAPRGDAALAAADASPASAASRSAPPCRTSSRRSSCATKSRAAARSSRPTSITRKASR